MAHGSFFGLSASINGKDKLRYMYVCALKVTNSIMFNQKSVTASKTKEKAIHYSLKCNIFCLFSALICCGVVLMHEYILE